MALTKKTTDRIAQGRLTVYMKKGYKPTETTWCARADAVKAYLDIQQINGIETELVRVLYNGQQIFPEIVEMSTKELCAYLKDHPHQGTVRSWVAKGKIPFHKRGGKTSPTYFKVNEIIKWEKNGRKI